MSYLHKILNNCAEVSLLALRSKEEKLPLLKQLELRIHLFYCRCCSNFVKQSDLMDKSLEHFINHLEEKPNVKATDDFKKKLKESLK